MDTLMDRSAAADADRTVREQFVTVGMTITAIVATVSLVVVHVLPIALRWQALLAAALTR